MAGTDLFILFSELCIRCAGSKSMCSIVPKLLWSEDPRLDGCCSVFALEKFDRVSQIDGEITGQLDTTQRIGLSRLVDDSKI